MEIGAAELALGASEGARVVALRLLDDAAVAAFENARDQALKKELDEAKADWADVLDKAKQGGVSNKWSQHAAENLSREFPDEYHALRQELVQGTDTP